MQLKKTVQTYQAVIIWGACCLLSLVGIFIGVVPVVKQTIAIFDQVNLLTTDVSLLKDKQAILQGIDEATLRDNLLTLTSAVPPDKSLATIMTTIDTVSRLTGVVIADFALTRPGSISTDSAKKLSADEAKIGSNLLPFSLTVRGSFEQIRLFLGQIVAVRRLFRVRSMTISFTGPLVEARIDLDGFYFAFPTSVGTVIQKVTPLADKDKKIITSIASLPLSSVSVPVGTSSATSPTGKADPFSP